MLGAVNKICKIACLGLLFDIVVIIFMLDKKLS